MVQKFQSPVRVYKYPFELVMKVIYFERNLLKDSFNNSQFEERFVCRKTLIEGNNMPGYSTRAMKMNRPIRKNPLI